MIDRISALEANLMALVRIVDDLQKEIEELKVIIEAIKAHMADDA